MVTFSPGTTASLKIDYPYTLNEKLKIKITATDGTFAEYTTTISSETTSGTFPDSYSCWSDSNSDSCRSNSNSNSCWSDSNSYSCWSNSNSDSCWSDSNSDSCWSNSNSNSSRSNSNSNSSRSQLQLPHPHTTTVHVTFAVNPAGSGTTTPSGSSNLQLWSNSKHTSERCNRLHVLILDI